MNICERNQNYKSRIAEEYEVIHDYDEAYKNAFDREYEELEEQTSESVIDGLEEKVSALIKFLAAIIQLSVSVERHKDRL